MNEMPEDDKLLCNLKDADCISSESTHGAGLIMISKAFYEFFIEKHACDEQFIKMTRVMGAKDVDKPEESMKL